MFEEEDTSSLIAFINSLFRTGMDTECPALLDDAMDELKTRVPLMVECYKKEGK